MSADAWNNANPDEAGGDEITLVPPADGQYSAMLVDTYAGIGKTSGNAFVSLTWEAPDGYRWKVLGTFKTRGAANMTKKMVRDLGVNVDHLQFDEVGPAIKELEGAFYNLTVKRTPRDDGGQWENTYIDGPAQGGQTIAPGSEPPAAAPAPVAAGDESIPF